MMLLWTILQPITVNPIPLTGEGVFGAVVTLAIPILSVVTTYLIYRTNRLKNQSDKLKLDAEADTRDRKINNDLIQNLLHRDKARETVVTELVDKQEELFGKLDDERKGRASDRNLHNQEIDELRTALKQASDLTKGLETQIKDMRSTMEQNEQRYIADIAAERQSKTDALALLVQQLDEMTRKRDELAARLEVSEQTHALDLEAARKQHALDLEAIALLTAEVESLKHKIELLTAINEQLLSEKNTPVVDEKKDEDKSS